MERKSSSEKIETIRKWLTVYFDQVSNINVHTNEEKPELTVEIRGENILSRKQQLIEYSINSCSKTITSDI
jgi:hypothetical protein